jgi:hypothetical protein
MLSTPWRRQAGSRAGGPLGFKGVGRKAPALLGTTKPGCFPYSFPKVAGLDHGRKSFLSQTFPGLSQRPILPMVVATPSDRGASRERCNSGLCSYFVSHPRTGKQMKTARAHGEATVAGIVDWKQKWDALKILCNAETKGDICHKVYGGDTYSSNIPDNFKNWFNSRPKNREFLEFFDKVAQYLGCSHVTGQAIITCSYDQFLDYLPVSRRTLLRRERAAAHYLPFNVDLLAHVGGREDEWLDRGVVDQRFMYVSRESVDDWNEVVQNQTYVTYKNCQGALNRFLGGDLWKNLVNNRRVGAVVILGAGAASKDVLIVNSILDSQKYDDDHPIKMFHFDSSFYMLADTIHQLDKVLRLRKTQAIELVACCADFMKLKEWKSTIRPLDDSQNVVFFILGNTIGNVNEEKLVTAIKAVSKAGDLFVVSAEFAPANDQAFSEVLLERYKKDPHRDLALNSIRNLLDDDGFSPHPPDRRALVTVSIEMAEDLPGELRSSVPRTIAAVFRTNRPVGHSTGRPGELVLVTSKRYVEEDFRRVMEARHGLEFREPAYSSPDDESYKHLIFERK